MKKLITWAVFLASMGMAQGADYYWVGGTSGSWMEASNWSPAAVPNSNTICVHITNEVPVTISMSAVKTIGALEFSGANHTITGELQLQKPNGGETPHVYVAEGCTATLPTYFQCATANQCGIVKTGKGTLVAPNWFGYRAFDTCEVREGTLKFVAAKMNGLCTVRSGARLVAASSNGFTDNPGTIVELEEGAVFDGGDFAFTFGGVRGAGIVTNFHNTSVCPVMTAGPLAFAGRIYGKFAYRPVVGRVTGEDGGYLLVGGSNTLADATLLVGGDAAFTNNVRFAPGVGTFVSGAITFEKGSPIVLEDTNGAPIRLLTQISDSNGASYFIGKGDLVKTTAHAYTVKGSDYAATGALVLQKGTVTAGTGTASEDAVGLEKLGALEVASDATFTMKNAAASDWSSTRIAGAGKVNLSGAGDWTIGELSLSGGSLAVDETAAASSLTIAGGAATTAYSVGPQTFETVISGGDHVFTKTLDGKFGRTYRQTGGTVTAELDAGAADGTSASFYTMTGGRLSCTMTGYRALGLDLSGDAEVDVRASDSIYPLLTHAGNGHEIRLRDQAVLRVDRFAFGFPSDSGTGVIRLDGGRLEVSNWIGYIAGATAESLIRTEIHFNGGVLHGSVTSSDLVWSAYADPGLTIGKVQSGGAKIDVCGTLVDRTLSLTWPFASDVTDGTDGGLLKTGGATLMLQKGCAVTGPFEIAGGRVVSTHAVAGDAVAGCGNVVLRGGDLSLRGGVASPLCANEDATFSFDQAASLTLVQDGSLTVGAATASANSVLNRIGHGVLVVSSGVDDGRLGSAAAVTVNGGVAVEPTAARLALPIFERCYLSASGIRTQQRLRFLTCDAENRLVPATAVAFDPSSSTRATVAEITGSKVRMTDDAEVGALNVEFAGASSEGRRGLTIDEGRTLRLGPDRAGAIAPLILNNTYAGNAGSASVVGGTIDFGASEGVIVLNYRYGSTVMMPQVSSVLAGTGGLTIAAPMAFRSSYAGAVSLAAENAYSGGTWIAGAVVQADHAGCFGEGGTVRVGGQTGEDGSIVFSGLYEADTFANPLEVAGAGPRPVSGARCGVLVFDRGLDLTGGVTLFGDATFITGAATAAAPAVFSAPVAGTGDLTLAGEGCVRFTAANSYAGDTVVASGVLEIADAGTLGTGSVLVEAGATLRFVGTAVRTVANPIRGAGRIECVGASVKFEDLSGFSGDFGFDLAQGATADLGGAELTVASLSGSGRVVNGRLTLTGEIQPGGAKAAGTLVLAEAPVVVNATLVIDGTSAAQSVDRFVIEEAFDLTGLGLRVPNRPGIVSGSHEIVTASAGLSGEFSSVETPEGCDMTVTVGATAAILDYRAPGLLLLVR